MKMLQDSPDSAGTNFSLKIEPPNDQQTQSPEVLGSSNNSRKVTREDIENVQNLIERCLQLYMNRNEVVNILLNQARIEPGFTTLVWQKLEEENADFFKAYNMRLMLKKQITLFNQLLEHQYCLMKSPAPQKVPLAPIQNGIQHMMVNNPIQHQPPIPICCLHADGVNGIPASSHLHPMQMNSGKGSPAGLVPAIPAIKPEMSMDPASVANDQFPFTPMEISDLGVNVLAIDSAYKSHVTSPEELSLGSDCGIYSLKESVQPECHIPWSFSFSDLAADLTVAEDHEHQGHCAESDILLDSPEQNIDEFFANGIPAPDTPTEEKS